MHGVEADKALAMAFESSTIFKVFDIFLNSSSQSKVKNKHFHDQSESEHEMFQQPIFPRDPK